MHSFGNKALIVFYIPMLMMILGKEWDGIDSFSTTGGARQAYRITPIGSRQCPSSYKENLCLKTMEFSLLMASGFERGMYLNELSGRQQEASGQTWERSGDLILHRGFK